MLLSDVILRLAKAYLNNGILSLLVQSWHSWRSGHFEWYRLMTRTDSRCVSTRNLESNIEKFRDLISVEFQDPLRPRHSSRSCLRDLEMKPRWVWDRSREGIRRIGIVEIVGAEPEPVRTVQPWISMERIPIQKTTTIKSWIFVSPFMFWSKCRGWTSPKHLLIQWSFTKT